MTEHIRRFTENAEYWFEEGCYILELSNSSADEDCSIARARVPAGGSTKVHQLRQTIERYVILEGEGMVSINGAPAEPVAPLDVVLIPKNAEQSISNVGAGDLVFLCICTPRFNKVNYTTADSGDPQRV